MSIVIHGLHLPKMIGGEEAHVDIRIFSGGDVIMATSNQPYYKKFRAEEIQEEPAPPQKAPLRLSCKHGEIGTVDDFATCYCPHHGYVGQKTECGEYEAKAGACGKCRQFDKGDNSTFGYCVRNDEIVNEASVKGCFEPKSKAEERPEPLGTVTTH